MRPIYLSALLAGCCIFPPSVLAGEETAGPRDVELAALYYYAGQKQQERLEAETYRLRLKYPDFVVPEDVYRPAALHVDESALWTLYEKNDFIGIEAEIGERRAQNPDWKPSEDFAAKLARRKQRVGMMAATARKDWPGVIDAAAGLDPAREVEVDLVWMLLDAYAGTGNRDALSATYRGLLYREDSKRLPDQQILATLQKSTRDFPPEEVRKALRVLATSPSLAAGAASVELDVIRREIAQFNGGEAQPTVVAEEDVALLRRAAENGARPGDLSLLGWYDLKLKAPEGAVRSFQAALAGRRDAEDAKGLYLALVAGGRQAEAYAVAEDYLEELSADPEFLMNALSLRFSTPDQPAADVRTVSAYSKAIIARASADHAEILAWYAYNSRQYDASRAWFEKSLEWKIAPQRVKGLALSLLRLGAKADYAGLEGHYREIYPDIWAEMKLATPPKGRRATIVAAPETKTASAGSGAKAYLAHFRAKRYGACISDISAREARGGISADAMLIKGWCHLELGRLAAARNAFEAALGTSGTQQDAAYGAALTLLRSRLTDDAEAMIALYPLSERRDREVRAEIYWQRARSAFDHKQYQRALDALNARASLVAEPADLSQLRGWSYYHLGNRAKAQAVFARLNMHLHDPAAARGLAVSSASTR
jgi:tetratricopeptide (TPR) repeat protein